MRKELRRVAFELSINIAFRDLSVGIDSSIPQKGPMGSRDIDSRQITSGNDQFLRVMAGAMQDVATWIRYKRGTPKLQTALQSNSISGSDVNAVGDRMSSHGYLPGTVLRPALFLALGRDPTDGCWVQQNLGPAKCEQSGCFGIPLIPTDADSQAPEFGLGHSESQISGRKVKLFVVQRVVGNVHLAILSDHFTVGVKSDGRIMIKTMRSPFEDRTGDHDPVLFGSALQLDAGRPGDLLGQIKVGMIFCLTRVRRVEDLLQANDVRATLGGFRDPLESFIDVSLFVLNATHLNER